MSSNASQAKESIHPQAFARRKYKPAIVDRVQQGAGTTIDLDTVRQKIANAVTRRAVELVDAMMQHIEEGNFQAMKYLFEAVGLLPIKMEDAQSAQNELGKKLSDLLEESIPAERENPPLDTTFSSPAVK